MQLTVCNVCRRPVEQGGVAKKLPMKSGERHIDLCKEHVPRLRALERAISEVVRRHEREEEEEIEALVRGFENAQT